MRNFLNSHWKVILAILLAIVLATLTLETRSALPLTARLQLHVEALAPAAQSSPQSSPQSSHHALRHVRASLEHAGYTLRRHGHEHGYPPERMVHVAHANLAPGAAPERLFIVGARLGPDGNPGAAALLELARTVRHLRLARGTEIRFVFFEDGALSLRSDSANFMAFIGSRASMVPVRHALAAFRSDPVMAREGLATPAHVMGVTSYGAQGRALVITDTGFLRFPYFRTKEEPEAIDYEAMAHIVDGLARTLGALAGAVET